MLTAIAGDIEPKHLSQVQTSFINAWLGRNENNFSKHRRAGAARTIFRRLWEDWGAPKLHTQIVRVHAPKPRNVTATHTEKTKIMNAAAPFLRCWLLLCSDLAIRSGTAATLGPDHYDRDGRVLTFRTKYGNAQHLPVTATLAALLDKCNAQGPFVSQLRGESTPYSKLAYEFGTLKKRLGITRKLTAHDLRRTTARSVYRITSDLRDVQALLGHTELRTTAWYLQDDLVQVNLSTLELAKLNPTTEVIQ
jgi:integrase/recombinase XerC